jgi:hypothetical protein
MIKYASIHALNAQRILRLEEYTVNLRCELVDAIDDSFRKQIELELVSAQAELTDLRLNAALADDDSDWRREAP